MSHPVPTTAPPPIKIPMAPRVLAALAAAFGAGAFGWSLTQGHPEVAWSSYLIGAFYVLSLGVFGVVWVAMLYLSKAVWSVSMRRVPEAMAAWLIPGGLLALGVALGGHSLYHWTDAAAVAEDELLLHKEPFLNMPAFYALVGVSLAIWVLFGFLIVRNSRRQDDSGKVALSRSNGRLSALFIVLFSLSFSVVSYYLLMSLEAHWFSTMYAVITFTDMLQTGTAFVAVIASVLILRGQLQGFLDENHLHSLAKMMFAATGFWAYVYFCQYLLIWYGNIPEETTYIIRRWENGWLPYFAILPLLKFVIPFVVMVPRNNKRKPRRILAMAVLILFAQFWQMFMLVSPAIGHGDHVAHGHLPWVEGAVTLGFLGLFFLVFAWTLGRHEAVPMKDPRLRECLEYHQ
jgi:hypothetical protein